MEFPKPEWQAKAEAEGKTLMVDEVDYRAPCETMDRTQLVTAVRAALKEAKAKGDLPNWKMTVSCTYAGYTKSITVKVKNPQSVWPQRDRDDLADDSRTQHLSDQRYWERRIEHVINGFNYNRSQAEYDHFDVGYFTHVRWM